MKYSIHFLLFLLVFNSNAQVNYFDSTFGTEGIVTGNYFQAYALALQGDGKILVGGGSSSNPVVYRFMPDGSLDMSFGENGKAIFEAGQSEYITDIAQLSNGDILAIGNSTAPGLNYPIRRMFFIRFNESGVVDTSLDSGGVAYRDFGPADPSPQAPRHAMASKMIVLSDGKIMISGCLSIPSIMFNVRPAIARFNADLSPDTTFNGTGYKVMSNATGQFAAMDIYDDGRIITSDGSSGNTMKIYRFHQTGQLDTSFGSNGIASVQHGGTQSGGNDVKITDEGKLIISGSVNNLVHRAVVIRTLEDGTIDDTFGTSGIYTIENNSGHYEIAVKSFLLPGGKIVTGFRRWDASYGFALAFMTANGAQDTAMGNQGLVVTPIDEDFQYKKLIQQPDGKLLALGHDWNHMYLVRYTVQDMLGHGNFIKRELSVYPNPASSSVTVSGLPEGTVVSIYNMSGQKLIEVNANGYTPIDISNLVKGIYILHTEIGSAKIIKR